LNTSGAYLFVPDTEIGEQEFASDECTQEWFKAELPFFNHIFIKCSDKKTKENFTIRVELNASKNLG